MPDDIDHDYEWTSERLSEDHYRASPADFLIYCCHLATYDFAIPYVRGQRVLDFGCGTGYGTHRLAPHCRAITGVDVSADAITYASARYQGPNLSFRPIGRLPAERTPFDDGEFDVVVSFQVIEHIPEVDAYVDEMARVLRPGGTLVVATPDRSTRLFRGQRPWNLFHVVEYDGAGLEHVLQRRFTDVEVSGMTASPDVAGIELRRARLLRAATLPFTFPRAPERWRAAGLRMLKRVQARRTAVGADEATDHGFGPEDIVIAPGVAPSLNLVAVATR
jgi:SAM-dependent methyltransferase